MDFKKRATTELCEKPSAMHVVDPENGAPLMTDDGKPVTISVLGAEGKTYQGLIHDETQKHLDVMARRTRKQRKVSAEANAEAQIKIVAKCTVSWSGVEWEGAPLLCDQDNAEMLYRECPWLREQVEDHMNEMENYLEKG